MLHHEQLPSAKERYVKEVQRVMSVLDKILEGKQWLVGDKCTYADLAFVSWGSGAPFLLEGENVDIVGTYPNYNRWMEAMTARPAVKATFEEKAAATKH
jgi:glutathione S-transferase